MIIFLCQFMRAIVETSYYVRTLYLQKLFKSVLKRQVKHTKLSIFQYSPLKHDELCNIWLLYFLTSGHKSSVLESAPVASSARLANFDFFIQLNSASDVGSVSEKYEYTRNSSGKSCNIRVPVCSKYAIVNCSLVRNFVLVCCSYGIEIIKTVALHSSYWNFSGRFLLPYVQNITWCKSKKKSLYCLAVSENLTHSCKKFWKFVEFFLYWNFQQLNYIFILL
jgi:hypothetical protein